MLWPFRFVGAVVFAALMALTGSTGGVYALHLLQRQLPLAPSHVEAQHVKMSIVISEFVNTVDDIDFTTGKAEPSWHFRLTKPGMAVYGYLHKVAL